MPNDLTFYAHIHTLTYMYVCVCVYIYINMRTHLYISIYSVRSRKWCTNFQLPELLDRFRAKLLQLLPPTWRFHHPVGINNSQIHRAVGPTGPESVAARVKRVYRPALLQPYKPRNRPLTRELLILPSTAPWRSLHMGQGIVGNIHEPSFNYTFCWTVAWAAGLCCQ